MKMLEVAQMGLISHFGRRMVVHGHSHLYPIVRIIFDRDGAHVHGTRSDGQFLEPHVCLVLETLVHCRSLKHAYNHYRSVQGAIIDVSDFLKLPSLDDNGVAMLAVGSRLMLCPITLIDDAYRLINLANKSSYIPGSQPLEVIVGHAKQSSIADVTDLKGRNISIVKLLQYHYSSSQVQCAALDRRQFESVVSSLFVAGLATVPFRNVALGDLDRAVPFCPEYGFSRGMPIDRYYLRDFINLNKNSVRGVALEIGGRPANKEMYGLNEVTQYLTLDSDVGSHADIIADAHDQACFSPGSLDSVLLFNVLEHCERPWVIVRNIHRWLRCGGRVLCVVPNAQRIHRDPRDYWRILPDALEVMFQDFSTTRVATYGSLVTVVASLSGLAAEELSLEDLAASNPQFPVVSTVIAEKG